MSIPRLVRRHARLGRAIGAGRACRAAQIVAASVVLVTGAFPATAGARWTQVSSTPSGVQPYLACPPGGHRVECQLIEDPTVGSRKRGPLREGAITRGPELQVSPALDGNGVEGGYSPEDLRAAYGLPSDSAGSGQTVAVVDAFDDPNAESDLRTYRSQYGIPPCTASDGCFRKVDQSGGTSYPAPERGWAGEISLDLDMVSAICPSCHILLVEASTNLSREFATAENEAVALGASEVSNSFGSRRLAEPGPYASAYDHPGIPITAAGGDGGYGVNWPAASPHVIAVGGATLVPASNARGWTETVWEGTGSGCSEEPKPAWQADGGCPYRTTDDVAAVADVNTPVSMYNSYETRNPWRLAGGTSVGTPIIAAAMALADPYTKSFEGAQALYLEAAANGTGALDDVISGSNGSCGSYLCKAGPGYDGPTGLGSLYGAPEISPSSVHPPTVLTEAPAAVTQTSARLNATVNPNGSPVVRCAFEYINSGASTPCANLPGSGQGAVAVSASVHSLIAGATYRFRIVAANPAGTSYGNIQALTTPPAEPVGLVTLPPKVPGGQAAPSVGRSTRPPPASVLASASLRVGSSGAITVLVTCAAGEPICMGTITLRTLNAVRVDANGHRVGKRILTLATGSFAVAGGRVTAVKLHLSARLRAFLARSRVLRARAIIVARDRAGATHTTQTTVTIYAPSAKRGRKG